MNRRETLTPDLAASDKRLDDHGRAVLDGFAEQFAGCTVEWISPAAAEKRKQASARFNEYCEVITSQVTVLKDNVTLLHRHRSTDTLHTLERFNQRGRKRFLDLLFPRGCGYIDLRAVKRNESDPIKKIRTKMVPAADMDSVEAFIRRYGPERDIYFGVAARRHPDAGRDLSNCARLQALFCDIDYKNTPEADARERLEAFKPAADLIVHSGGGLHVAEGVSRRLRDFSQYFV